MSVTGDFKGDYSKNAIHVDIWEEVEGEGEDSYSIGVVHALCAIIVGSRLWWYLNI
jgi:hypothetical protein